jgi:hypothetical protein
LPKQQLSSIVLDASSHISLVVEGHDVQHSDDLRRLFDYIFKPCCYVNFKTDDPRRVKRCGFKLYSWERLSRTKSVQSGR